ncbi:response regulator transcription factor [Ligilactobacillus equi]
MNNNFLLLTQDNELYIQITKQFTEQQWFVHHVTTATATITELHQHRFIGVIWDLRTSNLETCIGTIAVIRQIMNGPIICLTNELSFKDKLRLYKAKVDDIILLTEEALLVPVIKQRLWNYNHHLEASSKTKEEPKTGKVIRFDDLEINYDRRHLKIRGQKIDLTPKEFKLLTYLYEHKNQVLSREQILNGVWQYDIALVGTSRMVDIHISHLRDKIEKHPKKPQYLKTVRGFGYMFVLE